MLLITRVNDNPTDTAGIISMIGYYEAANEIALNEALKILAAVRFEKIFIVFALFFCEKLGTI